MKRYSPRFPVDLMSKVPGVSRSGNYKYLKFRLLKEDQRELDERIKTTFEASKRRYGSPRNSLQLNKQYADKKISAATVARRMQALRLVARSKRRFVHTTDSAHKLRVSPNLFPPSLVFQSPPKPPYPSPSALLGVFTKQKRTARCPPTKKPALNQSAEANPQHTKNVSKMAIAYLHGHKTLPKTINSLLGLYSIAILAVSDFYEYTASFATQLDP